jgi:hypothetical protein
LRKGPFEQPTFGKASNLPSSEKFRVSDPGGKINPGLLKRFESDVRRRPKSPTFAKTSSLRTSKAPISDLQKASISDLG